MTGAPPGVTPLGRGLVPTPVALGGAPDALVLAELLCAVRRRGLPVAAATFLLPDPTRLDAVLARLRPGVRVEVRTVGALHPGPGDGSPLLLTRRRPAVHTGTVRLLLHASDDEAHAVEADEDETGTPGPGAPRVLLLPRARRRHRPHRGPDGTPLPPWAQRLSAALGATRAALPRADYDLRFADDGHRCLLLAAVPASGILSR